MPLAVRRGKRRLSTAHTPTGHRVDRNRQRNFSPSERVRAAFSLLVGVGCGNLVGWSLIEYVDHSLLYCRAGMCLFDVDGLRQAIVRTLV